MRPENWPDRYIYSPEAVPLNIHPRLLRLCLSTGNISDLTKISSCIEEKRVHLDLKIQKISEVKRDHPLLKEEKESGFVQYGIFAAKKIKKGTELGEYVGRVTFVHEKGIAMDVQLEHSSSKNCWMLKFNSHFLYIDGQKVANEMPLVNDYRGIMPAPNAKPTWMIHRGSYYFGYAALRDIQAEEEIVVDYGKGYWESFEKKKSDLK